MVEMSIERERFVCVCLCVCLFLCMRVCVCSTCCWVFYMNHSPVKLRGHWKNLLYFSISVFLISWIVVTTTVAGGLISAFATTCTDVPLSLCVGLFVVVSMVGLYLCTLMQKLNVHIHVIPVLLNSSILDRASCVVNKQFIRTFFFLNNHAYSKSSVIDTFLKT